MSTKDKIKKEIDKLSTEQLEKVLIYIARLKPQRQKKIQLHSYNLNGHFDEGDLRQKAYE